MNKTPVVPVILCGGSGTRLWPLSRGGFPKQFLCLDDKQSLFQSATQRLTALDSASLALSAPLVVCNEEHRFLVLEQLRELGVAPAAELLEPVGKNTAPALTLAALQARLSGLDPVLVVTPADQKISDEAAFKQVMQLAINEADSGHIVILGITPDRPETGYGYIKTNTAHHGTALDVDCFVEKPDAQTAQRYLSEGGYYWNAGMFVLKASVWLAALAQSRPDILHATEKAWSTRSSDALFVRPAAADFAEIPAESIDYAVMEKQTGLKMLPLDAGWSDLGAWDAVWGILPKDAAGNAQLGDVIAEGCSNTLAYSSSRLVSLLGVHNLVVVETPDAILVADKDNSQDVKKIVSTLATGNREEQVLHRKVHRPWGWYDTIDEGNRFKVKRIHVSPKASLSLQKHHHRAEHWIVVAGTAEITNGEQVILLTENQSTYVPLGGLHRLANPGSIPLEIIEIQSGSYLGEDDIVRYADDYKRS